MQKSEVCFAKLQRHDASCFIANKFAPHRPQAITWINDESMLISIADAYMHHSAQWIDTRIPVGMVITRRPFRKVSGQRKYHWTCLWMTRCSLHAKWWPRSVSLSLSNQVFLVNLEKSSSRYIRHDIPYEAYVVISKTKTRKMFHDLTLDKANDSYYSYFRFDNGNKPK